MSGTVRTSPNVDNYMVGRGILYIAAWVGGAAGSYQDVGNCPRFEFEVNEQSNEHYSSRQKSKLLDQEVTIFTGYTLTFTLDEISILNMQTFLRASLGSARVLYANQDTGKRYAIRFISDNEAGPDYKVEFHKCKLTPAGPFSLIGDDWATLSFNGKGLADTAGHATSPLFTFTFDTTTSSTTTTTSSTN
jgi:hypothetical protein